MTGKIKPVSVQSFALGMNTRRADFKLATEAGSFMREIINCDVMEGGSLKRRRGYAKKLSATVGGSLWSDDAQAYYASGTSLMSLADVSGTLTATSVTGASLSSGAPVSFQSAPQGGAFWTDGVTLGYVLNGVSEPLVPPQPTVFPVLTLGAGTFDAGTYSICYTYTNAAGRESSAYGPFTQAVGAAGSLIFTLATVPGYTLNVYVSLPNGVTMYRALRFTTSGTQTLTNLASVGAECTTVGLANMPAGRFVRYNNGRLMVAVGSMLLYSKAFMPGLYDPTSGFIPLPATITVVEVVSNQGTFVASDQTYWFVGDIATAPAAAPLQYGAVMGSGVMRPDISGCFWMSARGIVVGDDSGAVRELQAENVKIDLTTTGASLMLDRDGVVQLLTSLSGTSTMPESQGSKYTSGEVSDTAGSADTWVVAEAAKASRRYLNYAFTGYAEINGRYYGVKADGVYLLEGDTDDGAEIAASWNPGRQDFGTPLRKRLESVYMVASSANTMSLVVTDDKGAAYTYKARRKDAKVQQQRYDVGRGLAGNFIGFNFKNYKGCDFEVSGFEIMAVETTRRLR